MNSSPAPESPLSFGPVPLAVYVAMFAATVGGQLFGMSADAIAVGRRVVWVPIACSVVLEAFVGARYAAARIGRTLSAGECARVSTYYSACLVALSLPLAGWTLAYNRRLAGGTSLRDVAVALGMVLIGLVAATLIRHVLMTIVSTSRGRS